MAPNRAGRHSTFSGLASESGIGANFRPSSAEAGTIELPLSPRAYSSAVRPGIPISAGRFCDHPFYAPASPAGRAGGGGEREPDGDAGAALLRIDARIARIALRSVMKAMIFIGPPQFEQTSGSTS